MALKPRAGRHRWHLLLGRQRVTRLLTAPIIPSGQSGRLVGSRCGSRWQEEGGQAAGKASLLSPPPPPPPCCWRLDRARAGLARGPCRGLSLPWTLSTKRLLLIFLSLRLLPSSSSLPSPSPLLSRHLPLCLHVRLSSPLLLPPLRSFFPFFFPRFFSFLPFFLLSCQDSFPLLLPSLPLPHPQGALLAGGRAGWEGIWEQPGWKVAPAPGLPRHFLLPVQHWGPGEDMATCRLVALALFQMQKGTHAH